VADDNETVSTEEAYAMIKERWEAERLLLSPSAAANLVGTVRIARQLDKGKLVTILPDNTDRYGEVVKKILS